MNKTRVEDLGCLACQKGVTKKETRPIVLKDAEGHFCALNVNADFYNRIHIYRTRYARNTELTITIEGKEYTIQP